MQARRGSASDQAAHGNPNHIHFHGLVPVRAGPSSLDVFDHTYSAVIELADESERNRQCCGTILFSNEETELSSEQGTGPSRSPPSAQDNQGPRQRLRVCAHAIPFAAEAAMRELERGILANGGHRGCVSQVVVLPVIVGRSDVAVAGNNRSCA